MTAHSIAVIPVETFYGNAFKWVCTCEAEGDAHDHHQRALEFGIQHLNIEEEEAIGHN